MTSNGTVNGDIVAAGGNVTVNRPVNGDVFVVGGNITVTGAVKGDLRAAGGNITIPGDVSEDVAAAGGQVTVGGRVGQDLIVFAGNLTLSGSVAGSTRGTAGTYNKSGTVAGNDDIRITPTRGAPVTPSNPVLDAVRQFIAVLVIAALALWLVPRAFSAAEAQVRGLIQLPIAKVTWTSTSISVVPTWTGVSAETPSALS